MIVFNITWVGAIYIHFIQTCYAPLMFVFYQQQEKEAQNYSKWKHRSLIKCDILVCQNLPVKTNNQLTDANSNHIGCPEKGGEQFFSLVNISTSKITYELYVIALLESVSELTELCRNKKSGVLCKHWKESKLNAHRGWWIHMTKWWAYFSRPNVATRKPSRERLQIQSPDIAVAERPTWSL